MDATEFLPAANRYLIGQDWDEGFATAAHLSLDLDTGAYLIESAGHPPTAHFDAGSGRWSAPHSGVPSMTSQRQLTSAPRTYRTKRCSISETPPPAAVELTFQMVRPARTFRPVSARA